MPPPHSATFERHFSRLVSLLTDASSKVDEQKVLLRALVTVSKSAPVSLMVDGKRLIADEDAVPGETTGAQTTEGQPPQSHPGETEGASSAPRQESIFSNSGRTGEAQAQQHRRRGRVLVLGARDRGRSDALGKQAVLKELTDDKDRDVRDTAVRALAHAAR